MSQPFTGKELSKSLTKKGFKEANSHHHFYFLYVDGKKTSIRTKVSHGSKTYCGNLLSAVKKQLHLSGGQLTDLVKCPMSEEEYIEHLKDKDLV